AREKRGRPRFGGGDERGRPRSDLLDGRGRRAASGGAGAWWVGGSGETSAGTLRNVWARQCVCRAATSFLPGGRSSKPGCRHDCAKVAIAALGHQWSVLRPTVATRSTGRFYLYTPSPHARDRGTIAEQEL